MRRAMGALPVNDTARVIVQRRTSPRRPAHFVPPARLCPDLATLNNDSYAEWFGHLFLSIEKHCGLWTSPVGVDGNVTYYYSDGKWTTSLP